VRVPYADVAPGVRFGPKPLLTTDVVRKIKEFRADGATVPDIMRRMKLSKGLGLSSTQRLMSPINSAFDGNSGHDADVT
jgi:hypothetical protein